MPGTGLPTVPSRKACGVFVVNAPVVSLIPYTSMIRTPRPPKNAPTSGGSGAAPLTTISVSPRPSSDRIGRRICSSAAANLSASSAEVLWPYWQLCTYSRPVAMAAATAAFLSSSCSPASSAWMPAMTFSKIRGTPKNAVGLTSPIVGDELGRRVVAEVRVRGVADGDVQGEHPLRDVR